MFTLREINNLNFILEVGPVNNAVEEARVTR